MTTRWTCSACTASAGSPARWRRGLLVSPALGGVGITDYTAIDKELRRLLRPSSPADDRAGHGRLATLLWWGSASRSSTRSSISSSACVRRPIRSAKASTSPTTASAPTTSDLLGNATGSGAFGRRFLKASARIARASGLSLRGAPAKPQKPFSRRRRAMDKTKNRSRLTVRAGALERRRDQGIPMTISRRTLSLPGLALAAALAAPSLLATSLALAEERKSRNARRNGSRRRKTPNSTNPGAITSTTARKSSPKPPKPPKPKRPSPRRPPRPGRRRPRRQPAPAPAAAPMHAPPPVAAKPPAAKPVKKHPAHKMSG